MRISVERKMQYSIATVAVVMLLLLFLSIVLVSYAVGEEYTRQRYRPLIASNSNPSNLYTIGHSIDAASYFGYTPYYMPRR